MTDRKVAGVNTDYEDCKIQITCVYRVLIQKVMMPEGFLNRKKKKRCNEVSILVEMCMMNPVGETG